MRNFFLARLGSYYKSMNLFFTFFRESVVFLTRYIFCRKNLFSFGVVFLFIVVFSFLFNDTVFATATSKSAAGTVLSWGVSVQQWVVTFLSWVIYYGAIYPMSVFVILLFQVLTAVASYNEFLSSAAVVKGWVVVRDMANMMIIVFLLIIAFGIMLGLESYGNRKMLAKLLVMAILINFSKTICGFFIDISQIIMLTFVNGFKFITGVSLVRSMQLDKMMSLGQIKKDGEVASLITALASIVLSALFLFVIVCVVVVIIMTLIWRIVNLWMLIILSPLAFLASAVPFLKQFTSDWYKKFSNFLINGPLLAFFLWLALTIMNGLQQVNSTDASISGQSGVSSLVKEANGDSFTKLTEAFTGGNISLLMISIGLLVGSLVLSASFGAVGANAAYGMIKNDVPNVLKKGLKYTMKGQDFIAGAASNLLFGKPLSVGFAKQKLKSVGTDIGYRAASWYHRTSAETSEKGGAVGVVTQLIKSSWNKGEHGEKGGRGTLAGRMDDVKGHMDTLTQAKDSNNRKADYVQSVARGAAMERLKAVQNMPNDLAAVTEATNLRKSLGEGENYMVTDQSIVDQKLAVAASREKLSVKERTDVASDTTPLATFNNDGSVEGFKYRSDVYDLNKSGGAFRTTASDLDKAHGEAKSHYGNLQKSAAKARMAENYVQGMTKSGSYDDARMKFLEERYKGRFSTESEIASFASSHDEGSAERRLALKKASDQGMIKVVMDQMGLDVNAKGLRKMLGYSEDEKTVRSADVELFQQVAAQGKKDDNMGLCNMIYIDPGDGKTYFADKPESGSTDTRTSRQFKDNMKRIEGGELSRQGLSRAMLGKIEPGTGRQLLSELGEEVVAKHGEMLKQLLNTGTGLPPSVLKAFSDNQNKILDKLQSGDGRYSDSHRSAFDSFSKTVATKQGITTANEDPIKLYDDHKNQVKEYINAKNDLNTNNNNPSVPAAVIRAQNDILIRLSERIKALDLRLGIKTDLDNLQLKTDRANLQETRKGRTIYRKMTP